MKGLTKQVPCLVGSATWKPLSDRPDGRVGEVYESLPGAPETALGVPSFIQG